METSEWKCFLMALVRHTILFGIVGSSAFGQVVLFNEPFKVQGSQLDFAKWTTERGAPSYLGRTQLGDWVTPGGVGQFIVDSAGAQLAVNTFNPTGLSLYGTQAQTLLSFQPSSASSITLTARFQIKSLHPGLVYAIYFYGCSNPATCSTSHDEIDLELVTNALQPGAPASVEINSYAAEPLGAGNGQMVTLPTGFDPLAAHEWSIQWSQQSIQYILDGVMLFSRTSHVPSGPMQANVEAWAPDNTWAQAFSASLQPVASAAQNQRFWGTLRSLTVNEIGPTSDPSILEYQVTGPADLEGITSGPDGALWFAQNTTGKIGRITTTGSASTYSLNSAFSVTSITSGPDGNLWFMGGLSGEISTTGRITKNSYVGGYGIAVGGDGALWFTGGPEDVIGRIAANGSVTQFATLTSNSYPTNIVAGSDGSLWFVEYWANKIGRITTAGVITEFSVADSPNGITKGPDGAIWFTYQYRPYIGRITNSGAITELPVWSGAGSIITGPDGALWFTPGADLGNFIGRMNIATGGVTTYTTPSSSANPVFLCTGPDGAIWFTENGTGKIGRLSLAGTGFVSTMANAASYDDSSVARGETVVLFGRTLGPSALAGAALDSTGHLASSISNTKVLFDGVPAPIIYVSDQQTAVVVPYEVAGRSVSSVVVSSGATTSVPLGVQVTQAHPGLFSQDQSGAGQGAIFNEDGSLNSVSNPARIGSIITIYGTGEGQTTPAGVDGKIAGSVPPKPILSPSVSIGGVNAPGIRYYGGVPTEPAGLFQINVVVPQGLAAGVQYSVQVQFGVAMSQRNVLLSIQ